MITNEYVDFLDFPTKSYFRNFLRLIGKRDEHKELILSQARELFGDESLVSLRELSSLFEEDPVAFFYLVSHYMDDPPVILSAEDRYRVAKNLEVPVRSEIEYLTITDTGRWLRNLNVGDNLKASESILQLSWYAPELPDIVPMSIFQFIKSATHCFRAGLFQGALTLAAIAFEASLRQAINEYGIQVIEIGRKYTPIRVQIDAFNDDPQVKFGIKLKGAKEKLADYFEGKADESSRHWLGNFDFRINREDLLMEEGDYVKLWVDVSEHKRDFLSSDVTTPTDKSADRFSEFNEIAYQHG